MRPWIAFEPLHAVVVMHRPASIGSCVCVMPTGGGSAMAGSAACAKGFMRLRIRDGQNRLETRTTAWHTTPGCSTKYFARWSDRGGWVAFGTPDSNTEGQLSDPAARGARHRASKEQYASVDWHALHTTH